MILDALGGHTVVDTQPAAELSNRSSVGQRRAQGSASINSKTTTQQHRQKSEFSNNDQKHTSMGNLLMQGSGLAYQ